MQQGTVKWFNDTKGYGFISPESGKDLFVHKNELKDSYIHDNDRVEFEVADSPKGPCAKNVRKI